MCVQGQVVRKGDRLAALDPTFAQADTSQLQSKLDSLNTQWASLDAELSGERLERRQDSPDSQIQSRLSQERQATYASQVRKQQSRSGVFVRPWRPHER